MCGSRKYPLKEPFVELLKGSLHTFLNAFTYPDRTCYPVASTNNKDFYNLVDVYLDAVFFPNCVDDVQTFQQEGWHYELNHPSEDITYKGVVFNEMKGVYSQPDNILGRASQQASFFLYSPLSFFSEPCIFYILPPSVWSFNLFLAHTLSIHFIFGVRPYNSVWKYSHMNISFLAVGFVFKFVFVFVIAISKLPIFETIHQIHVKYTIIFCQFQFCISSTNCRIFCYLSHVH